MAIRVQASSCGRARQIAPDLLRLRMTQSWIQPATEDVDAAIVRRMQQRDPRGLDELLKVHGSKIVWQLESEFPTLGVQGVDAALNQGAFRAWRSVENFSADRGSLRAWFYVIIRNCAIGSESS